MKIAREAFAAITGTLLQWYDFSLFGFLAPIIAKTYFGIHNTWIALLSTFAVFAVGYLMAPIGAIFFGVLGDKRGRKTALTWSVMLMTVPTFLIALLPGYRTIGLWAPVLLILCRLMQGFVASAEFAGSAIFMVEHAPAHRRCFYSSLTSSSYSIGMMLGALACSWLTVSSLPSWSWRIAFVLSGFGALMVVFLRRSVRETPLFANAKKSSAHALKHVVMALTKNPRAVFCTLGIACFAGVLSFGVYVYGATYLHVYVHMPLARAIRYITYALLVDIVVEPFVAMLADRVGKRLVMCVGAGMMLIALPFLVQGFSSANPHIILTSLLCTSLLIAISMSPSNALMSLMFPTRARYSGFGFSFNIGMSLFGGTTPLILTALLAGGHSSLPMLLYFMGATLVGLLALCFIDRAV
jgi:MFS transporter, MHS family, proline/betaine transporter